ncbi:hypothetical protein [Acinetobacter junii]|uniref:hypothetical protein n=1 Tax=Acinetobacter junii TaxID=40215 RepID=UPI0014389019|nr:hypothetical protein [Acinetobacter junii]NKG33555.1 hypothetical protein [Acinetobacter junii]UOB51080.1 hypothetical protein MRY16_07945 [Acinetobacter junii]
MNKDIVLIEILEQLLEQDEDITARTVAKLHPYFNHASSITRDADRKALVSEYQNKQTLFRKQFSDIKKKSEEHLVKQLVAKDLQIEELTRKVQVLTASHVAMYKAVGEMGGVAAWQRFFSRHQVLLNELEGQE